MTLFFDRNTGTALPRALQLLKPPLPIEYHQTHFPQDTPDDLWLADVGDRGWFVLAQDYNLHRRPAEVYAIHQHAIGVFYLWGANGTRWEFAQVFMRAFENLRLVMDTEPRPFVFRIHRDSRLRRVVFR